MRLQFSIRDLLWLLILGCVAVASCRFQPTSVYNIDVTNKGARSLSDVQVVFEGRTFDFLFGILGSGNTAGYMGTRGMPPIPHTLTVSWRDDTGTQHSVVAHIPETLRKRQSITTGVLEITITDGTVVVSFRE